MAILLKFPPKAFADWPISPGRASPSAEGPMTRPLQGLRRLPEHERPALDFSKAIGAVLAQIDGELARQVGCARCRKIFGG